MADCGQISHPPQKRLACDRCHMRKLRCFRDALATDCSRCIQFGFACTYSPPLKCGRPKKSSSATRETTPPEGTLPGLDNSGLTDNIGKLVGLNGHHSPYSLPLNAIDDQIYLASQENESLCHQFDSLPAACSDNLDFDWMGLEAHRLHGQLQHQSKPDSASDIEWDSVLEESLPCDFQPPWPQPGGKSLSDMMHSLARLQQELVRFRSQLDNPSCNSHQRISLPSAVPLRPTFSPIKSILKPSQELIDIISQVLGECPRFALGDAQQQQPAHLTTDRRTLLSLTFTPLSLLLSAYGDLLRDLRLARNHIRPCGSYGGSYFPRSMPASPSLDAGYLADSLIPIQNQHEKQSPSASHNNNNKQNNINTPTTSSSECHSTPLVPENLRLSLDEMALSRPLQIVLVTTIVKHHLYRLGEALQCPDLEMPESIFARAITELRTSTRGLIAEAQSLL
ncbi:hypothetical protein DPV78_004512 [Talaromyces pinophilus]|nr:hypothetical protein DPV78_004512 [Talaromyces pinophilus]